jgi:hypothetical protein
MEASKLNAELNDIGLRDDQTKMIQDDITKSFSAIVVWSRLLGIRSLHSNFKDDNSVARA